MLDRILDFDTNLFRLINHCRSGFGDWFFSIFSAHITIAIAVVLITIYVLFKNNFKYWYLYVLVIGLCFLLADRISVMCFKDVFCRLRPSHALSDAITVKLKHFSYLIYDNKGGFYGFVSSHAANTFSIIMVMFLIMRKHKATIFSSLIIVWGILTGYSRVYCGYHYPGDVLCGALLGIAIGVVIYFIYKYLFNKLESFHNNKTCKTKTND